MRYFRESIEVGFAFVSPACEFQAVVFVSHCRRQPDFRLALWSACPLGNRKLPFLLKGIPGIHFRVFFCQKSIQNNFQFTAMLLRSVIYWFALAGVVIAIWAKREIHVSPVWWKIRNGLVAPGLRKCSLPDRKCLQFGDIPFLTWQICACPSRYCGCCLLAETVLTWVSNIARK